MISIAKLDQLSNSRAFDSISYRVGDTVTSWVIDEQLQTVTEVILELVYVSNIYEWRIKSVTSNPLRASSKLDNRTIDI